MDTISLAERVQRIKPSPTLAVTARAAELRAAGHDIIGLGAGEPDFDTPEHIKAAAMRAIQAGATKYTAVDGTPALKRAIAGKFKRENKLEYSAEQILVSCGAKHSIYNLLQALLNPGDEVIIPAPYWVSYPDMVRLADGEPVKLHTDIEARFKITPEQLTAAISNRTRLFIINSPSNPTGIAYTHAELAALGEVLRRAPHVIVMTDDIYEHVLWAQTPFCNLLNACPDLYDRTVVVNGVSKVYAMTGWRIGYAAGPAQLIKAMKKVQSQSTSNPAAVSQAAAQAALEGDQSCVRPMVQAFHERHDYVVKRLNAMPGVRCLPGDGTFYVFADLNAYMNEHSEIKSDVDLAEQLITEAGVALVPGSAFGAPGHMRLSFATSMETLHKALDRLSDFLTEKA